MEACASPGRSPGLPHGFWHTLPGVLDPGRGQQGLFWGPRATEGTQTRPVRVSHDIHWALACAVPPGLYRPLAVRDRAAPELLISSIWTGHGHSEPTMADPGSGAEDTAL